MKKHNNSGTKNEPTSKCTKSRGPVQRDTKEVLAELMEKLRGATVLVNNRGVIGTTLPLGCEKLRIYEQRNSDEEWNQADEVHRLFMRNPAQENHQGDAYRTSC